MRFPCDKTWGKKGTTISLIVIKLFEEHCSRTIIIVTIFTSSSLPLSLYLYISFFFFLPLSISFPVKSFEQWNIQNIYEKLKVEWIRHKFDHLHKFVFIFFMSIPLYQLTNDETNYETFYIFKIFNKKYIVKNVGYYHKNMFNYHGSDHENIIMIIHRGYSWEYLVYLSLLNLPNSGISKAESIVTGFIFCSVQDEKVNSHIMQGWIYGGLGFNPPPPLGLASENVMCIEKRHHVTWFKKTLSCTALYGRHCVSRCQENTTYGGSNSNNNKNRYAPRLRCSALQRHWTNPPPPPNKNLDPLLSWLY